MRTIAQYFDHIRRSGASFEAPVVSVPMLVVRSIATRDEDDVVWRARFSSRMPMADDGPDGTRTGITSGYVLPVQRGARGAALGPLVLGRSPDADVHLPLPQVSKRHAYLDRDHAGRWSLADAGSRNGTTVNGRALELDVSEALECGAEIGVGPHRLAFYSPEGFTELLRRRTGAR